jgi:hypothetical protein
VFTRHSASDVVFQLLSAAITHWANILARIGPTPPRCSAGRQHAHACRNQFPAGPVSGPGFNCSQTAAVNRCRLKASPEFSAMSTSRHNERAPLERGSVEASLFRVLAVDYRRPDSPRGRIPHTRQTPASGCWRGVLGRFGRGAGDVKAPGIDDIEIFARPGLFKIEHYVQNCTPLCIKLLT